MSGRIVRRTHTHMSCPLPPTGDDHDIWECGTCGRLWRYRVFPNHDYDGWRLLWPQWLWKLRVGR